MIIIIEGPDKSGKSHLIQEVLRGFEEDLSHEVIFSSPDQDDGFGYMHEFASHLDSNQVSVWHRSWVSETIYGKALNQPRLLAKDEFIGEWFYSRLLNGRGGNFILLPEDPGELARRRDSSDFDAETFSPIDEYNSYKRYAEDWRYNVLLNDYTDGDNFIDNVLRARRSAYGLPNIIKIPSTEYVGSPVPAFTFVGKTFDDTGYEPKPFNSRIVAEYFRIYGVVATRLFGYATIESYNKNRNRYPKLFRRPIGVGGMAKLLLPELPNVFMRNHLPMKGEALQFASDFETIANDLYPGVVSRLWRFP